jgi:[ribosomal protein S18]-alanine N-acetyltransferase
MSAKAKQPHLDNVTQEQPGKRLPGQTPAMPGNPNAPRIQLMTPSQMHASDHASDYDRDHARGHDKGNGRFTFRPIDMTSAYQIATWQYPPPYHFYSTDLAEVAETVRNLLRPHYHYYTVWDTQAALSGYCCFGLDARVRGGDYRAAALDVGIGLRPDLTGQGLGAAFLTAVLVFGQEQFTPVAFRATVAASNQRALRVCAKVGFLPVQQFENPYTEKQFIILLREREASDDNRAEQQPGA